MRTNKLTLIIATLTSILFSCSNKNDKFLGTWVECNDPEGTCRITKQGKSYLYQSKYTKYDIVFDLESEDLLSHKSGIYKIRYDKLSNQIIISSNSKDLAIFCKKGEQNKETANVTSPQNGHNFYSDNVFNFQITFPDSWEKGLPEKESTVAKFINKDSAISIYIKVSEEEQPLLKVLKSRKMTEDELLYYSKLISAAYNTVNKGKSRVVGITSNNYSMSGFNAVFTTYSIDTKQIVKGEEKIIGYLICDIVTLHNNKEYQISFSGPLVYVSEKYFNEKIYPCLKSFHFI